MESVIDGSLKWNRAIAAQESPEESCPLPVRRDWKNSLHASHPKAIGNARIPNIPERPDTSTILNVICIWRIKILSLHIRHGIGHGRMVTQ